MSVENSDTFGNYLIHGIDEIMLPEAIGWWPSAPGWKVLGAVVTAWLLLRVFRIVRYWWRNRYRRDVLRQLQQALQQDNEQALGALPFYLKATALQAYPRADVASLSGEDWLDFLDAHYTGPRFSEGTGRKLLALSYLPRDQWQLDDAERSTLIRMVQDWISKHREAADV